MEPFSTFLRLLTLRSVEHPATALSGKTVPILLLVLVCLALWAGLTWFQYLPEPQFYPYGAPALSWYVLAALAIAGTMAKRSRPQVEFAQVCLLLAIVWPVLIVADYATVMWVPERWTNVAYAVWGLYALAYCARGMQTLTGNRQPVAVLGGTAVAAMFLWLASALYIYPAVWTSQDTEEYSEDLETESGAAEALLFEQPARIDASSRRDRASHW